MDREGDSYATLSALVSGGLRFVIRVREQNRPAVVDGVTASYSRGKNRAAHYHGGAGSMQEAIGAFDTGAAWGWIAPLDSALRERMSRARAVLFKNAR